MRFKTGQTTTCNYKLSRSIGFLFLIDRLKTVGAGTFADSWEDQGSDSSSSALTCGCYILIIFWCLNTLTVYHETLFTDLHDMNISSVQVPHTLTRPSKIHLSIVLLSITQLGVIFWKLPIPRCLQILVFLLFSLCS